MPLGRGLVGSLSSTSTQVFWRSEFESHKRLKFSFFLQNIDSFFDAGAIFQISSERDGRGRLWQARHRVLLRRDVEAGGAEDHEPQAGNFIQPRLGSGENIFKT